ncbi:MAG: MFS transporter, partial [Alphaproteobacteria bacterium]|nr:MFS transporter [Alphaproteobacteria bacterium]
LATLPYALKFLWAALIDNLRLPYLYGALGRRRSWMILSQLTLMISLAGLGLTNPAHNIFMTATLVFLVSLSAASQDAVIEAYRVEVFDKNQLGQGASASVLGFRLGMWVSGGGALYLAAIFKNWSLVYTLMAACVSIGIVATLFVSEPSLNNRANLKKFKASSFSTNNLKKFFHTRFKLSLTSFFNKEDWFLILAFIFLFKIGDTILNMMSIPFLFEIGFSKVEIAHIAKSFGIMAMIIGGIVGGFLLSYMSMVNNFLLCIILQIISCMLFMLQAYIGHHIGFLILTMGIENLACGISATTLVFYFSNLCHYPHTATHYALLSSFSSIARLGLSMLAGWLADALPWANFYALGAIGCLPCLMLLIYYQRHFMQYGQFQFTHAHDH